MAGVTTGLCTLAEVVGTRGDFLDSVAKPYPGIRVLSKRSWRWTTRVIKSINRPSLPLLAGGCDGRIKLNLDGMAQVFDLMYFATVS